MLNLLRGLVHAITQFTFRFRAENLQFFEKRFGLEVFLGRFGFVIVFRYKTITCKPDTVVVNSLFVRDLCLHAMF